MKKRVQLLLTVMLVLAMTACGEMKSPPQAESAKEPVNAVTQTGSEEKSTVDKDHSMTELTITAIPKEYKAAAENAGQIVRFDYETAEENKYAYVYLPYGYDENRQYDILYMMHGGGGSAESLFGGEGTSNDMKNAIDHLIDNGEMEPILIVTPTFYTQKHSSTSVSGSWDAVLEFPEELTKYLMPAVESAYSTYADTSDEPGFTASREHRAFGGFSMGSVTTWYVFQQNLNYLSKFIPISGDSWAIEMQGGRSKPQQTAKALADSVMKQGYKPEDYSIYAITGSEDIAEPCMTPMFEAMKDYADIFDRNEGGNTRYLIKDGGVHDMPDVKEYLYNLLPFIYDSAAENSGSKNAAQNNNSDSKVLVAYFAYSENMGDVSSMDVDAITSASLNKHTTNTEGNLQVMAQETAAVKKGNLFSILITDQYNPDYGTMVGIAQDDQRTGKQFTFVNEIESFDRYDTVYIGMPVWWGKLPQPMVSFFEEYDFSGKTIIPFGIHLGSRFGSMISEIKEMEPEATVLDGFTVSADTDNEKVKEEFRAFLEELK